MNMIAHQFNSHFAFPIVPSLPSSSSPPSSIPQILPQISSCPRIRFTKTWSRFRDDEVDPVKKKELDFFNENGTVDDMDAYLNYLSLEYDSVWDTKPSWCQPWTILTTGIAIIAGSWLVLSSTVVTGAATALVFLWWFLFLYSYPKAYTDMIAERRKKVTSGQEDTYGMKTE